MKTEAQNAKRQVFSAGTPTILRWGIAVPATHALQDGETAGSRVGIVFNGSPLFTGDAGSGESEIRRWIIENDWLECIIALPDKLFFQHQYLHLYLDLNEPKIGGTTRQDTTDQRR